MMTTRSSLPPITPTAATVSATVVVPVMSLCPSSKAISDYGAAQPALASDPTVRRSGGDGGPVSLTELVGIAEEEASCELYGLLKRADEKYVTERAYDSRDSSRTGTGDRGAYGRRFTLRILQRRRRKFRVDPQSLGLRGDRSRRVAALSRQDLV